MIQRALGPRLEEAAEKYPVLTVTGPRQSGKTTLVRHVFSGHSYASLEDPELGRFAREDPRGFLAQFRDRSVVLDEVQRAPDLFSYIQVIVDEERRPGRFILSGSQNFLLLRSISQSLAGRSAVFHLLPLSLSELENRESFPLSQMGRAIPETKAAGGDVMERLFRGFYPRVHDLDIEPGRWYADYYQTYVERDVRQIENVGDLESFGRFVRLCAGRNGQLLNLTSLGNDCGVSHSTAKRWISTLQASFLVTLLQPHHRNFNKRLIKTPKLYFLDTGLLCYLLRIRSAQDLALHSGRGSIFEAFVLSELIKNRLNGGQEQDLYFWRDSAGHEIDILIDEGIEQVAVEVKSGQTIASDYLAGLSHWKELVQNPEAPAALLYAGDRSFQTRNVAVCSWRLL